MHSDTLAARGVVLKNGVGGIASLRIFQGFRLRTAGLPADYISVSRYFSLAETIIH